VVIATVAVPALCARDEDPRRGAKRAFLWAFAFNFLYLIAVLKIFPRV
jgi:hypothetical protein